MGAKHVQSLKPELTYIYILSFIKKFRVIGVYDIILLFKMIELCNKYIYSDKQKLEGTLDNYEFVQIENKLHIIKNIKNDNIYITLSKDIDANIEIRMLDIRFFHLKATLLNRFIHDYGLIYKNIAQKIENEFELIFKPITDHFDNEFKIAISSDLAYFLSLNKATINYQGNLEIALARMKELRISIEMNPEMEPYWGYIRSYQYGYILLEYHFISNKESKLEYILEAKRNFELSLKELPLMAENLRTIVKDKIELCNRLIEVLK